MPAHEILKALRQARRRVLWLRLGARASIAAAAIGAIAAGALLIDRFLVLPGPLRIAVSWTAMGLAGAFAAWSLAVLVRRPSLLDIARRLEAVEPAFAEGLLTAAGLALEDGRPPSRVSPVLLERLERSMEEKLRQVDKRRAFDARPFRWTLAAGAMTWLAFALVFLAHREPSLQLLARLLHPQTELPRPSSTILAVEPGTVWIARGSDLAVRARLVKGSQEEAWIETQGGGGSRAVEALPARDGAFTRTFTAVRRDFDYRFRCGDFASPIYSVRVREPPRPARFRTTIHFPDYTWRSPESLESPSGDIAALAGSRVDLEVTASEPLAGARLVPLDGGAAQAARVSGASARFDGIAVAKPGGYRLQLETVDRVTNGDGAQYSIRPIADRAPAVEVIEPRAAEVTVEETSSIELLLDARDDIGIASLELGLRRGEQAAEWTPLDPGARSQRIDQRLLRARPGESVKLLLRARDALGQEGLSSERTVRIALLPDPPEGAGWPKPLLELSVELQAALEDWARLLPAPGGETPSDLAPDPAHVEMLMRAASSTLGSAGYLRRIAGSLAAAGRAIAVPSPNRRALEGLARRIAQASEEDAASFWAEASLVAGKLRESVEGSKAPVPCGRLYSLHRSGGARIEEALGDVKALLGSEELEDLVERTVLLEREAAEPPDRRRPLAGDATLLAASLTRAAGIVEGGDDLESAARDLLEIAAPRIDQGDAAQGGAEALKSVAGARARIQERYEKEERRALQARSRLGGPPDAAAALDALAEARDAAGILVAAQRAVVLLSEELELAESREYADFETTSDLSTMREMIERLAEAGLEAQDERKGGEPSKEAEAREIAAFYRASSASRALGRTIQELDRAATGQEDAAWRIRSASVWNTRSLRHIARTEREIRRLLESLHSDQVDLSGPIASLREAEEALAPAGPGAPDLERAAGAAGRAAGVLAGLPESLEPLRPLVSPDAQPLRERLRARLGTAGQRVARLAAAEKSLSARIRELALTPAGDPAAAGLVPRIEAAALSQEATRSEVERAAVHTRKEGDRAVESATGVDRLRLYDRAASELAEIAVDELLVVTRALRAAGAQGSAARSGTLIDASEKASRAAERLEAIARALLAAEAEDILEVAAKSLDDALKAQKPATPSPEAPPDPASVARDAQVCLNAALKAAQTLAQQAAVDPRRQPLLDLVRKAAELFRRAIELAEAKDAAGGWEALRAGRARLEEAVALAEKLRGDARKEAAEAKEGLGAERDAQAADGKSKELEHDLEAAYAELEKLLELERLERELAASMDEILQGTAPDRAKLEELERKERDLEEGLGEKYLTTAELVELVSKLVTMDRDGRELAAVERTLAAEAARMLAADSARALEGPAPAPEQLEGLKKRQTGALETARRLAKELQAAGFKLSAVLPHVLKAYWKAGEAMEPALGAVEAAVESIEVGGNPQSALLEAAGRIDAWLAQVGEMRHQALEAIADQERGGPGPNAAQSSIERARRNLAEASRLAREGRSDDAQRLRKQSIRSIADAAGTLRSRIADLTLPGVEEGMLLSKVLDEEAARLGLGWQVSTRGGSLRGAARLSRSGAADMPFPAQFREWVKVYMKALEETSP